MIKVFMHIEFCLNVLLKDHTCSVLERLICISVQCMYINTSYKLFLIEINRIV